MKTTRTTGSRWVGLGFVGAAALLAACSGATKADPTTGGGFTPGQGIGDGEIPGTGTGGESGGAAGAPSASPGTGTSGGDGSGSSSSGSSSSGGGSSSGSGSSSGAGGGNANLGGGVLTAGAWDDNRNYDLFTQLLGKDASLSGRPPLADQEFADANALWSQARAPKKTLDVSLVLDTTGSMGDELDYLATEFLALHAKIGSMFASADQRWSLVVYKDVADPYIVRWFDFRSDPNDFVSHLAAQSAGGGGDYPESPERALGVTSQLGWRGDDTAKLAFWIADAPHHDRDAPVMAKSIRDLRARGVHVYPVMASAADELTELTMRSAAELTGGRLLFLTDDSGVGDTHTVPRIPCYFVTKLDAAIERMVSIELSGEYREPDASDVIRTGGDPQSGRCTLEGGQEASVF